MTDTLYTRKQYTSWTKFKQQLSQLGPAWAFRGQRESSWALKTSLERTSASIPEDVAEKIVSSVFQRKAHHYLECSKIPKHILEWLALMQHHGAPTRLLDWTRSPYVAAYFSLEKPPENNDWCAVWAINVPWCKTHAFRQIRKIGEKYKNLKVHADVNSELFEEVILENLSPLIVSLEPSRMNTRLSIQQGLFLAPGNVEMSFMNNLAAFKETNLKKKVLKYELKRTLRTNALADLTKMNISRTSLFPGLDGFATSLNQTLTTFSGNQDIIKNIRAGKLDTLLAFS